MTKIQYDIPDDIHRRAKVAAAQEGLTLKDYIIEAIRTASYTVKEETK